MFIDPLFYLDCVDKTLQFNNPNKSSEKNRLIKSIW